MVRFEHLFLSLSRCILRCASTFFNEVHFRSRPTRQKTRKNLTKIYAVEFHVVCGDISYHKWFDILSCKNENSKNPKSDEKTRFLKPIWKSRFSNIQPPKFLKQFPKINVFCNISGLSPLGRPDGVTSQHFAMYVAKHKRFGE